MSELILNSDQHTGVNQTERHSSAHQTNIYIHTCTRFSCVEIPSASKLSFQKWDQGPAVQELLGLGRRTNGCCFSHGQTGLPPISPPRGAGKGLFDCNVKDPLIVQVIAVCKGEGGHRSGAQRHRTVHVVYVTTSPQTSVGSKGWCLEVHLDAGWHLARFRHDSTQVPYRTNLSLFYSNR